MKNLEWLLFIAACGSAGADADVDGSGLATVIDSTADTVVARTEGAVPEGALRRLVEEMRIAPAADDTSLFTEVFEFDVAPSGKILVFDRPTNTAMLFNAEGTLERRIGRQGAGPGEFNQNNGMVALGDTGWAVWDSRNGRISYFTAAGEFRTSSLTPSSFSTSNALVTDRKGGLYLRRPVTAPREGEILGRMGLVRITAAGALADSLVPPDIEIPRETYVAERNEKGNQSRSSTGATYAPGYHWGWHPDGHFVVGHGGTYEITLHRSGAKPLVIRRSATPVPVPAEEQSEEKEMILWQMRRLDPGWSWRGPALPETKAPLSGLSLTRDGRIWAAVAVPSEKIPAGEIVAPRDSTQPRDTYRNQASVYEVFAPDGRFLGRVVFPPRARLVEADGQYVWALVRDEDALPAVVRYRVEPAL